MYVYYPFGEPVNSKKVSRKSCEESDLDKSPGEVLENSTTSKTVNHPPPALEWARTAEKQVKSARAGENCPIEHGHRNSVF